MLTVATLEAAGFRAAFDIEAYEPVGCARCGGTGYKGRFGLYEVMTRLRRDPRRSRSSARPPRRSRAVAVEQGMRPLRDDGFEQVKHGVTSIAEVARVT